MKILALEFSSNRRSVAIADGKVVLAHVNTDDVKKPPLAFIDEALKQAELSPAAIETLALSIGPGSYTGIRSAIATAQGWQLARAVNLLPISSTEVLAATARANGQRGETHFIIDAQRHEYYHTTWNLSGESQTEITPLQIIGVVDACELEAHGSEAAGFPSCQSLFPDAAILAQLAVDRSGFQSGETIEPIYLRPIEFTKAPPPRQLD
ncbi:MAG: tRNA (adenosine(37)-N6)-threonylcarbamoyltransferase complex dimerization subunit type 1 TsaB [Verrucomicrobia subdivision 3 bacterium]|nr:tRNA (adenosine(37)-N6)-threonylcarbamoyltransferase complex dimerization subunit type 1 TsaB [Limisphaerales bacterium]